MGAFQEIGQGNGCQGSGHSRQSESRSREPSRMNLQGWPEAKERELDEALKKRFVSVAKLFRLTMCQWAADESENVEGSDILARNLTLWFWENNKQHFELGRSAGHDGFRACGQKCPGFKKVPPSCPPKLARLERRGSVQYMLDLFTPASMATRKSIRR